MKRELLHGHGVQGMRVDLSLMDMFAANQVAEELKAVVENHKNCEKYNSTPYDKRKELFPDGAPKRIEMSEKTLQNLHRLMCKLSSESNSTLFEELDENEEDGGKSVEDDGNAAPVNEKFCVQLYKVGPTKLQVIKTIKEFTHLSLKETKEMIDAAECRSCTIVAKDLSYSEALKFREELLESNAVADILSQSLTKT